MQELLRLEFGRGFRGRPSGSWSTLSGMPVVDDSKYIHRTVFEHSEKFSDFILVVLGLGIFSRQQIVGDITELVCVFF